MKENRRKGGSDHAIVNIEAMAVEVTNMMAEHKLAMMDFFVET